MGREIRRVPPDWEHPRDGNGNYRPLYDNDYDSAAQEWLSGLMRWERGENKEREEYNCQYFWDWEGAPPNEKYYRQKWDVKPTCYQIYQNVSEGTPVSPVFESLDDLIEWLIKQGHSRKAAERFAKDGWVPSMIWTPGEGVVMGIDALDWICDQQERSSNV